VARMLAAALTSVLAASAPMLMLRGTEAAAGGAAAAAAASSVLPLAEVGKDAEPVSSPVEGCRVVMGGQEGCCPCGLHGATGAATPAAAASRALLVA